eukprot:TRINITY_DN1823_c0_g1_i2.p1 TRINITY_DN1823_c0_g1~~TRINITY_DN1823_c0_g1_i2.p1  ORF type:complete len:107 (+),score=14.80 TRINITY_DN1823_c0_g1_i2:952-1272(+)
MVITTDIDSRNSILVLICEEKPERKGLSTLLIQMMSWIQLNQGSSFRKLVGICTDGKTWIFVTPKTITSFQYTLKTDPKSIIITLRDSMEQAANIFSVRNLRTTTV